MHYRFVGARTSSRAGWEIEGAYVFRFVWLINFRPGPNTSPNEENAIHWCIHTHTAHRSRAQLVWFVRPPLHLRLEPCGSGWSFSVHMTQPKVWVWVWVCVSARNGAQAYDVDTSKKRSNWVRALVLLGPTPTRNPRRITTYLLGTTEFSPSSLSSSVPYIYHFHFF